MKKAVSQANQIMFMLTQDLEKNMDIRSFLNEIEDMPSPQTDTFLNALTLIHDTFKLVRNNNARTTTK